MSEGLHSSNFGSQGGHNSTIGSVSGAAGADYTFKFRKKSLLPQTIAYLKQCNPQPSKAWTKALNTFIKSQIACGNWSLFDRLWIFATDNQQNARVSIVNPTSTQITEVPNGGTLTWTKDVGYKGDGVASYLNTNYTPSTQGVNYTLNSASIGINLQTNASGLHIDFSASDAAGVYTHVFLNYNGLDYCRVNNSAADYISTTAKGTAGLYSVVRSNSTTVAGYFNGSSYYTGSKTAVTVLAVPLFIAATNANGTPQYFSPRTYSMAYIGSGNINQLSLYNAWQTFLTQI